MSGVKSYEEALTYLEAVGPCKYKIRRGFVPGMNVPGTFYLNDDLKPMFLNEVEKWFASGNSINAVGGFLPAMTQICNVATLPGIVGSSLAMPDVHSGYGFAIGNVAAFDMNSRDAVVSPGGVGFDINCGVRLIRTNVDVSDVEPIREQLAQSLFDHIPVGVGSCGVVPADMKALDEILNLGVDWSVREGYSWAEDKDVCEEWGRMMNADASKVSLRAKKRGLPQLGTLGAGNHYCVVGNSPVSLSCGLSLCIVDLIGLSDIYLRCYREANHRIEPKVPMFSVWKQPEHVRNSKSLVKVLLDGGQSITCTSDHRLFVLRTENSDSKCSWVQAGLLRSDVDRILTSYPTPSFPLREELPSDDILMKLFHWRLELNKNCDLGMKYYWMKKLLSRVKVYAAILATIVRYEKKTKDFVIAFSSKIDASQFVEDLNECLECDFEMMKFVHREENHDKSLVILDTRIGDKLNFNSIGSNECLNALIRSPLYMKIEFVGTWMGIWNVETVCPFESNLNNTNNSELGDEIVHPCAEKSILRRLDMIEGSSNLELMFSHVFSSFNLHMSWNENGDIHILGNHMQFLRHIGVRYNGLMSSRLFEIALLEAKRSLNANFDRNSYLKSIRSKNYGNETNESEWIKRDGMESWYLSVVEVEHIPSNDLDIFDLSTDNRECPTFLADGIVAHNCEVQVVDEIYDVPSAKRMGIDRKGQVCILVHSGSRGLGHQVATDSLVKMERAMARDQISIVDRQLACARIHSPEGQEYLDSMAAAANFAWVNRSTMTYLVRQVFAKVLQSTPDDLDMHVIYDVSHNIAKVEEHLVDGRPSRLLVHRKGATRAFPPHHPLVPVDYQFIGQPVLVGGTMGTSSYLLLGTESGMKESFGSTCHGAGRALSRNSSRRNLSYEEVLEQLAERGVSIRVASPKLIAEEAPESYKDVSAVVDTCHAAGLSKKCVKLRPIAVIKG